MALEKGVKAFLQIKNEMDEKERQGMESYSLEFTRLKEYCDGLKSNPVYSMTEGLKPCNVQKNRYKDIIPFDRSRVKLKESSNSENDYINASFIKGTGQQNYIAAQGPLAKTAEDFWSVIWDYNVRVVVMACQEYEGIPPKHKCVRYWNQDLDEELIFGEFTIKMAESSVLPETEGSVIRRDLRVKRNDSCVRIVIHLHYTKWPDKFIPKCVGSILSLLRNMREYHGEERDEPVLLHCSAGCGRTGTLVVVDYIWSLLKLGKITDEFSIFDITCEMRRQRMSFVQSLEQYVFVYGAVSKLFLEWQLAKSPSPPTLPPPPKPENPQIRQNNNINTNLDSAQNGERKVVIGEPERISVTCLPIKESSKNHPEVRSTATYEFNGKTHYIGFPHRVDKPRGSRQLV